jgi:hypothetical protein
MNSQRTLPPRRRLLGLIAVVAIVAAACQPTGLLPSPSSPPAASPSPSSPAPTESPSSGPSGPASPADLSATYRQIEDEVLAIRDLAAKDPVDPIVLDDAGIKRVTAEGFEEDNPAELVDANERLLKGLGLLPADADLGDLYVELLGEHVAGLYSPDDKALYVVSRSGDLGPTEKTTFAHEYTHALQDQNFDLNSLKLDEVGEGDRAIGRLALVEGDATLVMSHWQVQHLSQAELFRLLGESLNPAVTAGLDDMPPILRESLLFPYTGGLVFVQALQLLGWDAVNDAYANPPASTEQVMHPEKYVIREQPVDVDLPDDLAPKLGDGWTVGLEDTFGEFQLKVWLDQLPIAEGTPSASDAAAGWGGDRVVLLDGPDDRWAIALDTAWDTAKDATEFSQVATPIVGNLGGTLTTGSDGQTVTVVLGSSGDEVSRLGSALGG